MEALEKQKNQDPVLNTRLKSGVSDYSVTYM